MVRVRFCFVDVGLFRAVQRSVVTHALAWPAPGRKWTRFRRDTKRIGRVRFRTKKIDCGNGLFGWLFHVDE